MKRTRQILAGIILLALLLAYGIFRNSSKLFPVKEETSFGVSYNFAQALRVNDKAAYDLTTPSNWQRLDEWMESHTVKKCSFINEDQINIGVEENKHDLRFYCSVDGIPRFYCFDVLDIETEEIEGRHIVIGWGEILEDFSHSPLCFRSKQQ